MPQTAVLWAPFSFRVAAHFNKSPTRAANAAGDGASTGQGMPGRLRARPRARDRAMAMARTRSKAKSPQSREHNKKIHDHKYPAGVKRSHRFRRRRRLCPSLSLALILSTQLVLLVASTFDLICSFSARTQDSQLELAAQFFCDLCLYSNASLISSQLPGAPLSLALFLCLLVALFISHFRIPFLFLFLFLLLHFQAIK